MNRGPMAGLDYQALFERSPNPYMVLDRSLRYVAVNAAYLAVTGSTREALIGRPVFEVFPNDPNDPNNEPVQRLLESFRRVFATGQVDAVPLIKFHVPGGPDAGATPSERFWSAVHTPIFDAVGQVEHLLQHTVEVTNLHVRPEDPPTRTAALQTEARVLRRADDVQRENRVLDLELRHLRNLFEQAPVFVCFLRGRDHVFEIANGAYLTLIGHENIIGRTVSEVLPEVVAQGFIELLDGVFTTGKPFIGRGMRVMLPMPNAEPMERLLDFAYQPICEVDGSISGIFVVGTDITDRLHMSADRGRLAAIVEQSGDFIGAGDMNGKMLFVNEAGYKLLGLSREQLASVDSREFFMPEDLPFVMENIVPVLMGLGHWRGHFRMRHFGTGEAIPVDYHVFAIRDPATGAMTGVASVTRDLRGLRELEGQRDAAAEDYRFLTNAIPVQIWTASPEGGLTFVSQRVSEYFGRTEADMLDSGWLNGLHPDDVQRCVERWTRSLSTGEPYDVEFRLRNAVDGSYRWHLARAVARRDGAGQITKWYGTNTDIEDQKRTAVERDELIRALEDSNIELDRFAYVASHDLKTPLRGIGNIAQWLEEDLADRLDDQSRTHLGLLRGRVQRMDALIDGVLKYSRAGKHTDEFQDVEVGELLLGVIDLLAPAPGVRIDVAPIMPTLYTSYVALQQVFLNLMSNAINHRERDELHIRVHVAEAGEHWQFDVIDDGPGIDPAHHERIWQLFQTLKGPAQARDHVNSGIGLSLVKRIVESRGGTVGVDSELGRGSRFYFTWPRREGKPQPV